MWDAAAAQDARAGRRDPHGHARSTSLRCDKADRHVDHHRHDRATARARPSPPATSSRRRRSASCCPACRRAPSCKAAADKLRYRDFLTVALIVEKPDLFPDNWIYIHEPSVKVGRIQNFRSWSPEMVPNHNSSCLGLEYFCFEGDGLWTATDGELIDLAKKELAKIGLAALERHQRRLRGAPEEGLSGLRRRLQGQRRDDPRRARRRTIPTLHLVGRNGMHKYNNQDHAMMTAC